MLMFIFFALLIFGLRGTEATSPDGGTELEALGRSFKMEETVKDLYDPPEVEPRFFFKYDQSAAFNTSVAFTIPLFSFTLPGAGDTSAAGLDPQAFGTLAFVALFLLGGLGVAIYTTTQGGVGRRDFSYDSWEDVRVLEHLSNFIQDSVYSLPEVLDVKSCAKLAVCGAHADYEKYGYLALPIKLWAP